MQKVVNVVIDGRCFLPTISPHAVAALEHMIAANCKVRVFMDSRQWSAHDFANLRAFSERLVIELPKRVESKVLQGSVMEAAYQSGTDVFVASKALDAGQAGDYFTIVHTLNQGFVSAEQWGALRTRVLNFVATGADEEVISSAAA